MSRISQGKIALKKEPVELARIIVAQRRDRAPADRRACPDPHGVGAAGAGVAVGGLRAPFAGAGQPAQQRRQVHAAKAGASSSRPTRGEGEATISVRDNGTGIEAALLPKVFDLFVQGDRALDRGQGGLGIGLTLVKRLVELHDGTVAVASDGPGPRLHVHRDAAVHQRGASRSARRPARDSVQGSSEVYGAPRAGGRRQRRCRGEHRGLPAAGGPRGEGGARRPAGAGLAQGVRSARGGARHRPARPRRLRRRAPAARARRHQPRAADRAHRLRAEGRPRARGRGRLRLPLRQARRPARDPGRDRARPQHRRRALRSKRTASAARSSVRTPASRASRRTPARSGTPRGR